MSDERLDVIRRQHQPDKSRCATGGRHCYVCIVLAALAQAERVLAARESEINGKGGWREVAQMHERDADTLRTRLAEAEQRGRALEEAVRSALAAPYDSKAIRILTAALSAPPPEGTMLNTPITAAERDAISKDGP